MTFQMQIRINSCQMLLWNHTIFKSNHTHTQRKFAKIQNHTHKNQMCNSKIINKKKTNSHKTLAIENQPNKQTNKS
jgi:hypothetical protein